MLEIRKQITLSGESTIDVTRPDGSVETVVIEGYNAMIDETNLGSISFGNWQNEQKLYRENRELCRKDRADFEDLAFTLHDELVAKKRNKETK